MSSIKFHLNFSLAVAAGLLSSAAFGTTLILDDHTVTANRLDGPYTSEDDLETAGFTVAATPEIRVHAAAYFAQRPNGGVIYIGRRDVGDADAAAALTAVEAVNPGAWFITIMTSRVKADIESAAGWHESRAKLFVGQTSDAAVKAGTAGNVGEVLSGLNYHNTMLLYYSDSAKAFDASLVGRCSGFVLDSARGSGDWANHNLAALTGDTLTTAERTQLLAYNCGWYADVTFTSGVTAKPVAFKGTAVSGRAFKNQTSLHMLQARLEEAFWDVFVSVAASQEPALLFDHRGFARLRAAGEGVINKMVIGGHFLDGVESASTGAITPYLKFPDPSRVSATDRQNGRLTGVTGEIVLAPAIVSVGDLTNVGLSITLSFV